MDQTWSNWISDEIIIEIYHPIFNFINFLIRYNHICQNGSKWIKLDQIDFPNVFSKFSTFLHIFNFWWNNHWNILSDFFNFILFLIRFSTSTFYKFLINLSIYFLARVLAKALNLLFFIFFHHDAPLEFFEFFPIFLVLIFWTILWIILNRFDLWKYSLIL